MEQLKTTCAKLVNWYGLTFETSVSQRSSHWFMCHWLHQVYHKGLIKVVVEDPSLTLEREGKDPISVLPPVHPFQAEVGRGS